ncbi:hypothetical protein Tco_0824834 [Tanacetum coccineum]
MHILHVPSIFFTSTGLEIQVGYRTGLTMSALTHSSTSFITALLLSVPKTLRFYATGGTEMLRFRVGLIIRLGTLVISEETLGRQGFPIPWVLSSFQVFLLRLSLLILSASSPNADIKKQKSFRR